MQYFSTEYECSPATPRDQIHNCSAGGTEEVGRVSGFGHLWEHGMGSKYILYN